MGERAAKQALFDGLSEVAKALGNGRRAELVDVLAQGERNVEELAGEIGQSVANTSFHLRALAAAGLVQTRREATRIYYRLASDRVGDLWAAVRDVAAAHGEQIEELVAAYVGDRDSLDEMSRRELLERLESGDVVLVDVRPAVEFEAGHIEGARSIPIDELSARLAELDDTAGGAEIVAYCRGPYCAFADEAVRVGRENGRKIKRLEGGYPEWRRHVGQLSG